jgi:hypothetical protein
MERKRQAGGENRHVGGQRGRCGESVGITYVVITDKVITDMSITDMVITDCVMTDRAITALVTYLAASPVVITNMAITVMAITVTYLAASPAAARSSLRRSPSESCDHVIASTRDRSAGISELSELVEEAPVRDVLPLTRELGRPSLHPLYRSSPRSTTRWYLLLGCGIASFVRPDDRTSVMRQLITTASHH